MNLESAGWFGFLDRLLKRFAETAGAKIFIQQGVMRKLMNINDRRATLLNEIYARLIGNVP